MLGENNDQQKNSVDRAHAMIERTQNAYNSTGKIKEFIDTILLTSMTFPLFLLIEFVLYSRLVDYFFKLGEN
ncbi:hypothetical protein [Wolbachia pipientis]|uniref:hypothetical protein n=1 Tax=Wolbachia pipientis TaxID=955 RepID=UPI0025A32DE1|nr:hypothetical protein [Wolbachia pipientis]MDM8335475.1 hypothetical protein [Wolbachia pipientis]